MKRFVFAFSRCVGSGCPSKVHMWSLAALMLVCSSVLPARAGYDPGLGYNVQELSTLGGNFSDATSINDSGTIVGNSAISDGSRHASLWQNGAISDLGTLGGSFGIANQINNKGQIVGYSTTATGSTDAFYYSNGRMVDLGTFGAKSSLALSINNNGQIVGAYGTDVLSSPLNMHAFMFDINTAHFLDLGTLGGSFSIAQSINDSGDIVGKSSLAGDIIYHAFQFSASTLTDLGTLIGSNGFRGCS
ncbi:MAG: hypothetical protein ACJ8FY_11165 [Gemmataceae bacterium]